ncbi:MAG: DUF3027 domain-containing protein [Bifidobacteriaceae bacterium]|jgi:hypothetical protein|nr:DUF3027 domain-containing protein [Bifidobacteriaceae bacterium]
MKASIDLVLNSKAAKDLAKKELLETVEKKDQIGKYLRSVRIDSKIVAHYFSSSISGYDGWEWEVVMARPSLSKEITIYSSTLVAGENAIKQPKWVPWAERIRPSDVQTWDALDYQKDDPTLVYSGLPHTNIDNIEKLALWRERVISPYGKRATCKRWMSGKAGLKSKTKKAAKNICTSCGFFVPLSGQLGQGFGACSNAFSPNDGTVVAINNGCGAHSETSVPLGQKYLSIGKLFFQDTDVKMNL